MSIADTAEIAAVWDRYARSGRTPRRERNAAGATTWFNWTAHADHGPDEAVLGPLAGKAVLELGSGTGGNIAHLAMCGADATGLDVSPTQTAKATTRWGHLPRLTLRTGEAVDYLTHTDRGFDAIYSVFGAAWFTDPDTLLPLVRQRLTSSGVFAFSHALAADALPQPPNARIPRYDFSPSQWTGLLVRHGFADATADVIAAPGGIGQRTLLARTRRAEAPRSA